MNKEILIKNIVYFRKKEGLTQRELSEKLNYSDKVISKWERGESLPDVLALTEIAAYFNVSIDKLILVEIENSEETYAKTRKLETKRIKGPSAFLENSIWFSFIIYFIAVIAVFLGLLDFMVIVIASGFFIGYSILWAIMTVNVSVEANLEGNVIRVTNSPTKLQLYINDVLVDELDALFCFNVTLTGKIGEHLIKTNVSGFDKFRCTIFVE